MSVDVAKFREDYQKIHYCFDDGADAYRYFEMSDLEISTPFVEMSRFARRDVEWVSYPWVRVHKGTKRATMMMKGIHPGR